MRRSKSSETGEHLARRIHEETPRKRGEGVRCPDCGAAYLNGRWTWKPAGPDASPRQCPACKRIAADAPGGVLRLGGGFLAAHRAELIARVRHVEERERAEHPLKRLMSIDDEGADVVVSTTDARLAAAIGRALLSAYGGSLARPRTTSDPEKPVRLQWTRD